MPIYEYRCQDCEHELEVMQRISADALTTCPDCGTESLKRLISQTSFVLKGSGWYATDYGGKASDPAGSPDAGGAKQGSDSGGTTSDSSSSDSSSSDSATKSGGGDGSTGASKGESTAASNDP